MRKPETPCESPYPARPCENPGEVRYETPDGSTLRLCVECYHQMSGDDVHLHEANAREMSGWGVGW